MNRALNKEILRLSLPSILANITIPLVGIVDTSIAGHIPDGSAAVAIAAISVGSLLFNLLYWNFSFLRVGTAGQTAQAYGRRDFHESSRILARSLMLSLISAAVLIALRIPFVKLSLLAVDASYEVESLALQYFSIRIWAAPATLSLLAFSGWFSGMQDSLSSMWKDLIVNTVNIASSIFFTFGTGSFEGMGFRGIALGTVVAQYSGMLFCLIVCAVKYGGTLSSLSLPELPSLLRWKSLKPVISMNTFLFGRSICFIAIYIGYTILAAPFGDLVLSSSSIMMQLLMIFSYFTDGFAAAGESLTGRFIGEKDQLLLGKTVKYVFVWSLSVVAFFIVLYGLLGVPLLKLMTTDPQVVDCCRRYLPWLIAMPPLGCIAFTWDGIYVGATASRDLFFSMLGSIVSFFAVWYGAGAIVPPDTQTALHYLMAAYFSHLIFRSVYLSLRYRSSIKI